MRIGRLAPLALVWLLAWASGLAAAGAVGIGEPMGLEADSVLASWHAPGGGSALLAHGRTRAEAAVGGWQLLLPPLDWIRAGHERLTLAGASLEIVPVDEERARVRLTLPATMPLFDRTGQRSGQVTLGRQRIEGLWDRRLGGLSRLDLRIDQIRGRGRNGRESFHLATMSLEARFEEGAAGAWSGKWSVELSDLSLGEGAERVRLALINLAGSAGKMRLLDYAAAAQAMGIDWRRGPQGNLRAAFARQLPALIGPVDLSLSVHGLELGSAGREPAFALDHAKTRLMLEPAGGERLSGHLVHEQSGFLSPLMPSELTPARIDLALDMTDALAAALGTLFAAGPLAALQAAGARIVLPHGLAENASLALTLKGSVASAVPGAPYVGAIEASLAGLPELLDGAAKRPAEPGRSNHALMLTLVRGFGQPRLGADRRILYDYHLELDPAGRLTVNGHDLTALKALLTRP
ncbi:MAG: hypothetical protein HYR63_30735 [Proteobacteria bacterium]|nr:hypothetical protein [Pseudomonadota bacterium]